MSHQMGRALGTPAAALPFPVTRIAAYKFTVPQVLEAGLAMAFLRLRDQVGWRRQDAPKLDSSAG